MAAGFDRDPMLQQEQDFIAKFGFGLGVRHRDAGAARLQEQGRGHARLAEAHDEDAFVVEIHEFISPRRHRDTEKKQTRLVSTVSPCLRGGFLS